MIRKTRAMKLAMCIGRCTTKVSGMSVNTSAQDECTYKYDVGVKRYFAPNCYQIAPHFVLSQS